MRTHPVTGMQLEDGHGAHPDHVQAARHCDAIEKAGNKAQADEFRAALGIPTSEERAEAEANAADEHHTRLTELEAAHASHHERLSAMEENAKEHAAMKAMIDTLDRRLVALEAKGTP